MTDNLTQLASRVEAAGIETARRAMGDYDNVRHGRDGRDRVMTAAASYFTVATALRALSTQEPTDG